MTKSEQLFEDLKDSGYGLIIGKKEYAEIAGISLSTLNGNISNATNIPPYQKLGNAKNATVKFSLRDVVEFLTSNTIVTVA